MLAAAGWRFRSATCSARAAGATHQHAAGSGISARVDSLRRLIEALDFEIDLFATLVARRLREHPGYPALLQILGVGPVMAAIFVAEIGGIGRFRRSEQLAYWAGLTPKHHESDTTVHRGRITKMAAALCGGP